MSWRHNVECRVRQADYAKTSKWLHDDACVKRLVDEGRGEHKKIKREMVTGTLTEKRGTESKTELESKRARSAGPQGPDIQSSSAAASGTDAEKGTGSQDLGAQRETEMRVEEVSQLEVLDEHGENEISELFRVMCDITGDAIPEA
eukprot:5865131-Amphidinium_carterae.3